MKIRLLLILFLIIAALSAPFVLAGPLDSLGKFTSCTAGNYISNLIYNHIINLRALVPGLSSVTGFSAVPVEDIKLNPKYQAKEYVQDIIARCAAREILTAMNKNILNVARTAGRDGGSSFVRNWRSFILGSQYRGEDIWRGLLYVAANGNGSTPPLLCDHIRNSSTFGSLQPKKVDNLIEGLGTSRRVGTRQEYLVATKCDPVVNDRFDIFMKDFSAGGGWNTFEKLLQPQNNIYGATELALDELNRQREIEKEADINEAIAGSGFTSIRGTNARNSSCVIAGLGGSCIVYKDINTPGSVIFEGVNATTLAELTFVANADELNEVIAAGIQVLFNRMLNLGNPDEGSYQIPGSVDFDPNSLPPPEGGGGGLCSDQGGTANYTGNLLGALNTVIANNPDGIADALNTTANSFTFLNLVAQELQSAGFNATTSVLNGNSNPNNGDLIAVWISGDPTMERYDAVSGAGDGDRPLRTAARRPAEFTGDIPLTCVP